MKRQYWLVSLFGLLLFLYFIPSSFLYSGNRIVTWFIFGLILLVLPYLVYKTLISFNVNTKKASWFAALSVLIVGPGIGLLEAYRETKELEKSGVWTKAVIVSTEFKYSIDGNWRSLRIKSSFDVNGKSYRNVYEDDDKSTLSKGDTLDIIYSKNIPEMNLVSQQWIKMKTMFLE